MRMIQSTSTAKVGVKRSIPYILGPCPSLDSPGFDDEIPRAGNTVQ